MVDQRIPHDRMTYYRQMAQEYDDTTGHLLFSSRLGAKHNEKGEGMEVHVFGEVAILTGVQVAQMRLPDGKARSSQVMLSNVFLQRDQGWCIVLSHAFELVQDL